LAVRARETERAVLVGNLVGKHQVGDGEFDVVTCDSFVDRPLDKDLVVDLRPGGALRSHKRVDLRADEVQSGKIPVVGLLAHEDSPMRRADSRGNKPACPGSLPLHVPKRIVQFPVQISSHFADFKQLRDG
jgi:hypothetical protein